MEVSATKNMRMRIQLAFVALTNGYISGFLEGKVYDGNAKKFCVPGLNCYSCPGALGSCPIGALQAVISHRSYNVSFYILGFFLLIGTVLGKFVCGWLCPFGLVQDLFYKIPFMAKRKKLPGDRALLWLKYVILLLFVVLLPLFAVDIIGQGQPYFCKYICPSGTLMGGGPLFILDEGIRQAAGWLYVYKWTILAGLLLLSIFVYRPFCRYLCPLGAIYGMFNKVALTRYCVDKKQCTSCGQCQKVCKLDIDTKETPNHSLCIRCGDCKRNCPTQAIRYENRRKSHETVSEACGEE